MDLVKKNIISIICGVVIIAVIIVKFVVLDGYFDNLEADGKARVAVANTLHRQLDDKSRRWPRISPDDPVAKPLTQFPSKPVIQQGQGIRQQGEEQSAQMYQLAVRNNQESHPVLGRISTLANMSSSDKVQFQQDLRSYESLLRTDVLQGTLPPTHDEMEARAKTAWDTEFEHQKVMLNDMWANEKELKQRYSGEMELLPGQMREERAKQFKVYLDTSALPMSAAALDSSRPMDDDQIWYNQMSYWIQHDVATTIRDLNKSSSSIEEAPIKRLISIDVAADQSIYVRKEVNNSGGMPQQDARSSSASPNPSDTVDAVYALSPTGRVCNSIYDVAHFQIRADVAVDELQNFIDALSTRRLLTVRVVNSVASVDYHKLAQDGFLYGNRPVVEVTLDCEELFMRQWTVPLMPQSVRRYLNISDSWKLWEPPAAVAQAPMTPR